MLFFFKQKTAYEMRISDWSSDVCSSDLLRGRKWSLYEGGIRQPLILYWRGHSKAGYRDERTVGQGVDLLPTLARLAGVRTPAGIDGVDLSPVIEGRAIAQRPDLY